MTRKAAIGCWILNAGYDQRFTALLADATPASASRLVVEPALQTLTPYPQAREFPVHCALPYLPEDDEASEYPSRDLDEVNAIQRLLIRHGFGARERQRRRAQLNSQRHTV